MLLKMVAFAVQFWSTLDAYFISLRIEIKLEAEISVSLFALHVLYTSEKKSVCISGMTFSFNKQCVIFTKLTFIKRTPSIKRTLGKVPRVSA